MNNNNNISITNNDFWTGHILFNRSYKNLIVIDYEHKYNILSGSDQIFL